MNQIVKIERISDSLIKLVKSPNEFMYIGSQRELPDLINQLTEENKQQTIQMLANATVTHLEAESNVKKEMNLKETDRLAKLLDGKDIPTLKELKQMGKFNGVGS